MQNKTIDFLFKTVKSYPDKHFIVDEHTELTYSEFLFHAHEVSQVIQSTPSLINSPIPVLLDKSALAVVSFAGILLSGNFYVPIDIKSPEKRINSILNNLYPKKIISSLKFKEKLEKLSINIDTVIFIDNISQKTQPTVTIDTIIESCEQLTQSIIDVDPCYIIHTSGSTGTPKGVIVPHRGIIDYIEWALSCLDINEYDIIGNQAPFYFDNSTLDIYLSWATGATLNLIPEKHFLFPIKLIEYLEKAEITFIFFVPSVLVSIARMEILSKDRLPQLKNIIFAGEVMPTKHLSYWQKLLPDKTYVNLYGPTEITVDCTYFIVDRIYSATESLPIGYPCKNSGILILTKNNTSAKINEHGELCVRGSSLALGYWNDEEKNNTVFVQNPLQKNYFDRIYKTGDIVFKNEKEQIIFVGRKDSQIKHLGYRIEIGEIELAVNSLPFIDNCCVLYNNSKKEIILFYSSIEEISISEFRKHLALIIPSYMIPRSFNCLDSLPMTPNGKIDRKALNAAL